ncbi:glycosyltransferase [Pseudodesulfovibrio sp. zrk46]|uniref:glycosyltransferase family protein n=1 Tax=Pseudodesulfovibrio sp. zrk46 TaxID=2725288 RepID=UPI001FFD9017|nr:glycosyltransferase [Pseudodesulfovibrio sp. zrk46]
MPDIHRVCLIDTNPLIAAAFEEAGCEVLRISTGQTRFFNLPPVLEENGFVPDMLVQTETLANRSLVVGLDTLDCPTLFWAMDPHLNAYWHSAYANLFDVTCSTQRKLLPRLREQGAEDVRWLPMCGRERGWKDMADRAHDITFVGRVSAHRPARKWMIELLRSHGEQYDVALEHSLTYGDMLNLYEDSRLVPNESIFGEVNFRLFEGASCGCLVLSQNLGDEQEALFEPGREFDTYSDVVELDDKLRRYLKNPRLMQTMGRAARERVLADHLPKNRAQSMLEFAADASRRRATGPDAEKWLALTAAAMWESGLLPIPMGELLERLKKLEQGPEVAAALLQVQTRAGMDKVMKDNLTTILAADYYADSPVLNMAGSMASLAVEHWDGAKAFWYRHLKTLSGRDPQPPTEPWQLLTLWAKDLKRRDQIIRAGFPYDPNAHLPKVATDCLMLILKDMPEHLPTLRLLDTMLRPVVGLEQARVGYLSILTLHERNDWRLAFEIALANLKSYRLKSGMEELHVAREIARQQGQEAMFAKALAARDESGLLAARLG